MCFLPRPLPGCPELVVTGTGTAEGTYEVSATQTTVNGSQSAEFAVQIPKSCLDDTPCDRAFAGFGVATGAQVVATETTDSCVIAVTEPVFENSVKRSTEIDGLTMTDEAGRQTEFCQVGSQLRIQALDDNPFGVGVHAEAIAARLTASGLRFSFSITDGSKTVAGYELYESSQSWLGARFRCVSGDGGHGGGGDEGSEAQGLSAAVGYGYFGSKAVAAGAGRAECRR
jgi:hypothetical protein